MTVASWGRRSGLSDDASSAASAAPFPSPSSNITTALLLSDDKLNGDDTRAHWDSSFSPPWPAALLSRPLTRRRMSRWGGRLADQGDDLDDGDTHGWRRGSGVAEPLDRQIPLLPPPRIQWKESAGAGAQPP